MLTIRLARVGKTKQAQYRMVVADHRRAVTGRFIDVVGNVNPLTDPATVTLKKEEISRWLQKGAQPSQTVRTILVREDMLKAPKGAAQRPSKAPKRPDKYGKAETAASVAEAPAIEGVKETPASEEPSNDEEAEQPQVETPEAAPEVAEEASTEPESSEKPAEQAGEPQGDTQE